MTFGSVSAFAVNPNSNPAGPCGTINGQITVSSSTPRLVTVWSWTTPGYSVPSTITVSADVDSYSTGELVYSMYNSNNDSRSATAEHQHALFINYHVSAFGAHTATKNGQGYGCYTSKTNFVV